jgi:preprotein translocase subunit SecA
LGWFNKNGEKGPGKIITLMSSSFGRGTDIVVVDKKIKAAGGLHVIEHFCPLSSPNKFR